MTSGTLTLVATPIGNLSDISPRAVEALQAADVVCCEDTRRTGMLLQHLGISGKKYIVINEHTEFDACDEVVGKLLDGTEVALVSDAGTPGISDPGERLVKAAVLAGITVSSIPGPSALIMALVMSGLSTSRFVFEGFLPRSGGERSDRIAQLVDEQRTVVLYEAPHRLERTLSDLEVACGALRRVVLARELTKMHEEMWRGTLHDAHKQSKSEEPRGEYVIILEGAKPPAPPTDEELNQALRDELNAGASKKDAASRVAAKFGAPKRKVYELALMIK
ncbi:ribosomal RNA small subunit methyltransferase I [Actinomycetes bacterium]|nr:ribosomal RNA small subunit methyltransferase I [Actinomycetes bacterium]